MNVDIRELKARLSEYLARVRKGTTLVITDRGTPVARLERIEVCQPPAALEHLTETGLLVDKAPPRHLPASVRMLPGDKTSTDYVAEQRR